MEALKKVPIDPNCPWADWTRPNIRWCEDYVCDWIVTPANTWSNLAYLIVAYFMHIYLKGNTSKLVWLFVPATIMTGITSFAYHASVARLFQLLDFFGMFTFTVLAVILNLKRDGFLDDGKPMRLIYAIGLVICGIAIPVFEILLSLPIQATVLVLVIIQLIQEIKLRLGRYRKHPHTKPPYRRFLQSLLFLSVALACSAADLTRLWCDHSNHFIQGHAVWHVLSAIGLYCLFLFYAQIDFDRVGEGYLL
jgi:hypothetical protein